MPSDKILERVRALLAIAEHPNTPPHETDTALTQANRLMAKHAIEEATLRATQISAERRAVERKKVKLNEGSTFEFQVNLRTIMSRIAVANRLQAVMLGYYEIELFGMHDDIVWAEQLYTQIYFDFISKLSPKWDNGATYESNVYRFKNAGLKWKEIDVVAVAAGEESREDVKVYSSGWVERTGMYRRMHAAYKREVKRLGDTNVVSSSNPTQYRRDFAEGFTQRIVNRLWQMQEDNDDEAKSSGAELVLSSMTEEVRVAYEEAYPQFSRESKAKRLAEYRAQQEREGAERNAMLDAMTEKQRYEFLEKERRAEERANKAYWKNAPKTDYAGQAAGSRAADSVNLARNAGATQGSFTRGELN